MNKKENEIIKKDIWLYLYNMPENRELYSPAYGLMTFKFVDDDEYHSIVCYDVAGCTQKFFGDGSISNYGECVLFPNASKRYWEDWQRTLFKTNDIITNMYTGEVMEFMNLQEAFNKEREVKLISYDRFRFASKEEKEIYNDYVYKEE